MTPTLSSSMSSSISHRMAGERTFHTDIRSTDSPPHCPTGRPWPTWYRPPGQKLLICPLFPQRALGVQQSHDQSDSTGGATSKPKKIATFVMDKGEWDMEIVYRSVGSDWPKPKPKPKKIGTHFADRDTRRPRACPSKPVSQLMSRYA